ncbi:MAG: type II secretion system minor pseudopilin GspK [Burkholderiaceae bacterium]|nr:type II secretion system minor pseudopilin GspK [Burkholderiaceae bacterium]
MTPSRHAPRARQRGAALLTALVIVTLVLSLSAAMVWRQYRSVEIEAADRARVQADWILLGALDYARLILREDARANQTTPIDDLGEVWAVPLAETKLSTFLAADQDHNSDDSGPQAYLSGQISDAQSRYNLRNLISTSGGRTGADPAEVQVLQRIFDNIGVAPALATQIATQVGAVGFGRSGSDAGLNLQSIDQLGWLGLSPALIEQLRPYVVMLPQATPVNINTAPREVLAALADGMDLAAATRLVQTRVTQPFHSLDAAKTLLPANVSFSSTRAAVMSSYFFVDGRLRMEGQVMQQRSLVQRNGLNMVVLARDRVNPAPP